MFPIIDFEENQITEVTNENSLGKTYLFDFETGEFVIRDGKLVIASELEAIEMWVRKIIITEKFKFKIYEKSEEERDQEYGVTFKSLIGKKLPRQMVKSEIKRELTEVLLEHPEIIKIFDFEINQDGAKVTIKLQIHLNNETIELKEVLS